MSSLEVRSNAFRFGGRIPDRFTGHGLDMSPPIEWSGVPAGTVELALLCHDPDAPRLHGWTHWVLTGIPATTNSVQEGTPSFRQGVNDWGSTGYRGPLPPGGHGIHHYYFHLFALSQHIPDGEGIGRVELLSMMEGILLAQARLVGEFGCRIRETCD